jgi:biopolymer transport protein ExbD
MPLAKAAKAKTADLRAVIRADRKVEHGRVIHVLDLLKRAGVAKIAFAVSPTDRGSLPVETQPSK